MFYLKNLMGGQVIPRPTTTVAVIRKHWASFFGAPPAASRPSVPVPHLTLPRRWASSLFVRSCRGTSSLCPLLLRCVVALPSTGSSFPRARPGHCRHSRHQALGARRDPAVLSVGVRPLCAVLPQCAVASPSCGWPPRRAPRRGHRYRRRRPRGFAVGPSRPPLPPPAARRRDVASSRRRRAGVSPSPSPPPRGRCRCRRARRSTSASSATSARHGVAPLDAGLYSGAISRVHPALGPGATTRRRVLPPRAPHQRLLHRRHALRRRRALQSPPPTRPLSSRCWDRSDATSATFAARNRKPNYPPNRHHCGALWYVA